MTDKEALDVPRSLCLPLPVQVKHANRRQDTGYVKGVRWRDVTSGKGLSQEQGFDPVSAINWHERHTTC